MQGLEKFLAPFAPKVKPTQSWEVHWNIRNENNRYSSSNIKIDAFPGKIYAYQERFICREKSQVTLPIIGES